MKKSTKMNLFFLAAVLLAAAALYLAFGPKGAGGRTALLQYGAPAQSMSIPLNTDKTYDIDTGTYTIHLKVEGGGIAFVDSPCPDHTCEGFGVLRNSGDWAACLPARASVTIE